MICAARVHPYMEGKLAGLEVGVGDATKKIVCSLLMGTARGVMGVECVLKGVPNYQQQQQAATHASHRQSEHPINQSTASRSASSSTALSATPSGRFSTCSSKGHRMARPWRLVRRDSMT
jgi:hypothetical protein